MKFSDLKVGMKVYDRNWSLDRGIVVKVLKTRIHVQWIATLCSFKQNSIWKYDRAHCQFLEEVS